MDRFSFNNLLMRTPYDRPCKNGSERRLGSAFFLPKQESRALRRVDILPTSKSLMLLVHMYHSLPSRFSSIVHTRMWTFENPWSDWICLSLFELVTKSHAPAAITVIGNPKMISSHTNKKCMETKTHDNFVPSKSRVSKNSSRPSS